MRKGPVHYQINRLPGNSSRVLSFYTDIPQSISNYSKQADSPDQQSMQ